MRPNDFRYQRESKRLTIRVIAITLNGFGSTVAAWRKLGGGSQPPRLTTKSRLLEREALTLHTHCSPKLVSGSQPMLRRIATTLTLPASTIGPWMLSVKEKGRVLSLRGDSFGGTGF